jgi:hypothetical protein
VATREIIVKKYVVNLSEEERSRLDEFIRRGKRPAQLLTKARILLKADISESGEGWSDSRIAEALGLNIMPLFHIHGLIAGCLRRFRAAAACSARPDSTR